MMIKQTYLLLIFVSFCSLCSCNNKTGPGSTIAELDTISFSELSKRSYDYLNEQQKVSDSLYKISSYQNWFYDQNTGELTFSDSSVKKLIIDYEEVGSLSFKSNTWLWAWENPHLEQKIRSEIGMVRDYGAKRKFKKLTDPKWKSDEYDAWEMTAIASYLMKAKGAYRVPVNDSSLLIFMIYKNIRWADSSKIH